MKKYARVLLLIGFAVVSSNLYARDAWVFKPPSNVRDSPYGRVICQVRTPQYINVFGRNGDWYVTDFCGVTGMIHQSQVEVGGRPRPPRDDWGRRPPPRDDRDRRPPPRDDWRR